MTLCPRCGHPESVHCPGNVLHSGSKAHSPPVECIARHCEAPLCSACVPRHAAVAPRVLPFPHPAPRSPATANVARKPPTPAITPAQPGIPYPPWSPFDPPGRRRRA